MSYKVLHFVNAKELTLYDRHISIRGMLAHLIDARSREGRGGDPRAALPSSILSMSFNYSFHQGEVFCLEFRFRSDYPFHAPTVVFVVDNKYKAPVHPVSRVSRHRKPFLIWTPPQPYLERLQQWSDMRKHLQSDWDTTCYLILRPPDQGTRTRKGGWSPSLSVLSVCITLHSMLASCKVSSAIFRSREDSLTGPPFPSLRRRNCREHHCPSSSLYGLRIPAPR